MGFEYRKEELAILKRRMMMRMWWKALIFLFLMVPHEIYEVWKWVLQSAMFFSVMRINSNNIGWVPPKASIRRIRRRVHGALGAQRLVHGSGLMLSMT